MPLIAVRLAILAAETLVSVAVAIAVEQALRNEAT